MGRTTKADYAKHYRDYQGKPEQIKKRSQRNKARRAMEKAGKVRKGDGKDVHHRTPIAKGGGNSRSNLAVSSASKNRGYKRGKGNRPK